MFNPIRPALIDALSVLQFIQHLFRLAQLRLFPPKKPSGPIPDNQLHRNTKKSAKNQQHQALMRMTRNIPSHGRPVQREQNHANGKPS